MEFKVTSKYLQDNNRTHVSIRKDWPYTVFERVLSGDRTNEPDNVLIEAVLGLVATEFNPAEGVKQLQEELKTQEQTYDKKLEEKDNAINAVKAIANWAVLARVTDVDNPLDPTVFKRGLFWDHSKQHSSKTTHAPSFTVVLFWDHSKQHSSKTLRLFLLFRHRFWDHSKQHSSKTE